MLFPGDLGFSDLILVIFFFFVTPVVGFVIRRKWRLAVARKEEIKRLVILASEESARAELEAAVEYGTVSVVRQFQCAVCYSPTTTRCSRCKAVRYCSGKCQIIHWRQGHKEECHPPSTTSHGNGEGSNFVLKAVLEGEQREFCGNIFETEGRWCAKPTETSTEEPASSKFSCSSDVLHRKDDDKIEPLVDAKGTETVSESSSTSLLAGFSTSTGTNESLVDVSVSEAPISSNFDRSEVPQPDDVVPDTCEITIDAKGTKLTNSPPSELTSLVNSANRFSDSSKLKQKTPSFSADEVHCSSADFSGSSSTSSIGSGINGSDACMPAEPTASSGFWGASLDLSGSRHDAHDDSGHSSFIEGGGDILSDSDSHLRFSFNLSGHTVPSSLSQCSKPMKVMSSDASPTSLGNEMPTNGVAYSNGIVTDLSRVSRSPALNSGWSDSITNDRSNGPKLLKSKGIGSLPSNVSDLPPRIGVHSVPAVKSSKVDDRVHTDPTGLLDVSSSLPNVSNGLKTVRKVVQQFRSSKFSVYNPLAFGTEIAGKYSCEMIFPYDRFVKLYNSEKVQLYPCGLTNCGNSCYANAVLQCLAFTRPLSAYLLQGLHSKACPKKEWCFTCEFEDLILKAREGRSPLSPIGILSQIQNISSHLGHGREEDAHEFLRYAIDTMQSICLKEAGLNAIGPLVEQSQQTTLIGLMFGGYLRSKIKCMKCQGKSEQHERMMDLTVEIHGDIGTLEEALTQFTATEILDGENKYQCGRCKSYEKAKKKLTVLEAPNVLTIVLKRFQSGKFGKLNKSVRFPEILDLAPYMSGTSDKSPRYRLYAVVVHLDIMNAAFSGHYVCYVRNFQGRWFKIDDSTVKPVELERVLSKGAYMLLYTRFSPRAPSLVRKSMSSESKFKRSKHSEAVPSSHSGKSTISKARPNTVPSVDPAMANRRPDDYPTRVTRDHPTSFESFDSDDWRFSSMSRIRKVDSSSDNSSLFSCSDEGSCSTESTRDSTSTDDFSDYLFGETGRGWNSPMRISSDSNGSSPSPLCSRCSPLEVSRSNALDSPDTNGYPTCSASSVPEADGVWMSPSQESSRKEDWEGRGNPPILYSDTTKQCKRLTNHCNNSSSSSCNRETDSKRFGWVNPLDVKSGVSFRRSTRDRTAQTFY